MDQDNLIERSLQGDLEAFNQLVIEYQGLGYGVAYRLLDDPDSAADALQDSFIKAFRALEKYRGGSFKSWLMRIVVNTCYDHLRSRQRKRTESLDDLPVDEDYVVQLTDRSESPHEFAERRELQALIGSAITSLPEVLRTAIVLRDVEGYAYEEIAEITSAAVGTVKSRINRARGRVRDYLGKHAELLPSVYRHSLK
jgi:RNA polymerase sigma-70 factor (ECF subfamily)